MQKAILQLETLACPTCMQKIAGAIANVDGVEKTSVKVLFNASKAKADFERDLAERKAKKNAPAAAAELPKTITVSVNGQNYQVNIAYGDAVPAATPAVAAAPVGEGEDLLAPLEGKFYLVKDNSETPKKVGDRVAEGDILGYIEAMKTFNAIRADKAGVITAIIPSSGDSVEEDDVIMKIG